MQHGKKTTNNNDQTIIGISRVYIQDFVESNYGRKLTEPELEELSWFVWDGGDDYLLYWIGEAVDQIIAPDKT